MAKQIITRHLDDLDGSEADRTIVFGFDGMLYSIDLSEKNLIEFTKVMAKYVDAAARLGRAQINGITAPPTRRTMPGGAAESRELNQRIREWAGKHNFHISERGRIPMHVVNAYHNGIPHTEAVEDARPANPDSEPAPTQTPAVVRKVPAAKFAAPAKATATQAELVKAARPARKTARSRA